MSRIRGKDTTPERIVRSLLHRLGYRFRLHVRLPLSPIGREGRGEGAHCEIGLRRRFSSTVVGTRCRKSSPTGRLTTKERREHREN